MRSQNYSNDISGDQSQNLLMHFFLKRWSLQIDFGLAGYPVLLPSRPNLISDRRPALCSQESPC